MFSTKPKFKSEKRSQQECEIDYFRLLTTAKYPSSSKPSLFRPSVAASVQSFVVDDALTGQLAVVTGVFEDSIGFHVAQQLALQHIHVVLLGKSISRLRRCAQAIKTNCERDVRIYTGKFDVGSSQSILEAAREVRSICNEAYSGRLAILANLAHVGTDVARLTKDGLEYNTGCNLVGTHLFITELMELLEKQNEGDVDWCSRVVNANSMGHCCGTNFSPQRLADFPQQGGAPEGFLIESNNESLGEAGTNTALLPVENITVVEKQTFTQKELQEAVRKRGTQVGRSKMGLLAATFHMDRLVANVTFFSVHLAPDADASRGGGTYFATSGSSRAHAAIPVLRAALDRTNLLEGCYLHSDGQPWEVMIPGNDPDFCRDCFEASSLVIDQILSSAVPGLLSEEGNDYSPPTVVEAEVHSPKAQDNEQMVLV